MRNSVIITFAMVLCISIIPGCGGGGGGSGQVLPTIDTSTSEADQINAEITKQGGKWVAAENSISAMPDADRKKLNGLSPSDTASKTTIDSQPRVAVQQLPSSLDWRSKDGNNWMTSVKNQGRCGSCVAFASVAVTEALVRISNSSPEQSVDLSESELFSCGGGVCSKGWHLDDAADRLKYYGVVDESCLPYQAADYICNSKCSDWQSRLTTIDSWKWVSSTRSLIKEALLDGPVMAGMRVYSDFYYYKSGIYKHVWGSKEGAHAVTIVGYNDSSQYWIVKNSWGSSWGESGYFRIAYGDSRIESTVLSFAKGTSDPTVTAYAYPTEIPLSGGQAQTTLTCSTSGTITTTEARCDTNEEWAAIPSGNTQMCTYTAAGSYTPGCRVNGSGSDNVDTIVTVTEANQPPTGVTLNEPSNATTSSLNLQWTQNTDSDFASYKIYRSTSSGVSQLSTLVDTITSKTTVAKTVSGLSSGTNYYFIVYVCDTGALCTGSNEVNGITSPPSNQAPIASVTAVPTTGTQPLLVQFTGGCSDSDGTCVSYSWNFGDGSTASSSQNPSHTFNSAGTFVVVLTVADNENETGQRATTIFVGNDEPAQVLQGSAGGSHTCMLTSNNGVKCWGFNYYGQLGDGTLANKNSPVDVTGLTSGVAALSAGTAHTCIITINGSVRCYGANIYGQLGDGTTTYRNTPVNVLGLTSGVAAVSAGYGHTCIITTSGGVKCWGYNAAGQLGDETTMQQNAPVNVSGLQSNVTSISAGKLHTCAVTSSGGVKCWGYNSYGQLGDGTTTDRDTPVNVLGLTSGVAAVSAGKYHTCAITDSGGVKCWGKNDYGQLGDGTTNTHIPYGKETPVQVSGLTSGVTEISAGDRHTCVLTTSGGAKCWGQNTYYGQLGDGTLTDSNTPVNVYGLTSGVTEVSAGNQFTCAVTDSGGGRCWGKNEYGQLGDGTTINSFTPIEVVGF